MSRRLKFHIVVAALVLLLAFLVNWLITAESSPFANYFLWHVGLSNMWAGLNFIPAVVAAIASGNVHGGNMFVFYVGFCVQWLLVGFILSFVLLLFRFKREEPTTFSG